MHDLARLHHARIGKHSDEIAQVRVAPVLLTPGMPRLRRRSSGATLMEILTATAIFSILLAIGVPNLQRLRGPYALRSAGRQMAADLQMARQRAITRNARIRVVYSPQGYILERETAPNSWTVDSAFMPLPHPAAVGTVDPGNPVFDSRGMLATDVTVPVSVAGTGTRTVTINVLGRTTVN